MLRANTFHYFLLAGNFSNSHKSIYKLKPYSKSVKKEKKKEKKDTMLATSVMRPLLRAYHKPLIKGSTSINPINHNNHVTQVVGTMKGLSKT